MRIFLESIAVTCTRIAGGYKIDPYFNRKEIENLLFQAFFEGLSMKIWEGTRRGKGSRVMIQSMTPWTDMRTKPTKNDMTGLNFTVYHLDRRLPQRAIRWTWK